MSWDRRQVLGGAAAAVAAAGLSGTGLRSRFPIASGSSAAAGWANATPSRLMQVAPVEIVALCDVDRLMLEDARKAHRGVPGFGREADAAPELYRDYRSMLAKHKFDIVIVGTPDHWHALPAIAAMKAAAHVYLEKPISLDVAEARPWSPPRAPRAASSNAERSAAPRRPTSRRATASCAKAAWARSAMSRLAVRD